MITLSNSEVERIDELISTNQIFALYKMPQADSWQFVMQCGGEPEQLHAISQLNEKEGYVVAPFQVEADVPLVLFRVDTRVLPSLQEIARLPKRPQRALNVEASDSDEALFAAYEANFNSFMKPLQEGKMPKLVLSRYRVKHRKESRSVARVFEQACCRYPNAYVYLVNTPQTGLWMGSTPEVILAGKKEHWQTVALAGTQLVPKKGEATWDQKNIHEQDLVVQYVAEQLQKFGVYPRIVGPSTIEAGPVMHLVSHFYFTLPNRNHLGDLLQLLHPTPAVCGLPKEEAYQFIVTQEKHRRKYYSGFIGELSPTGSTQLFVNLRCMQVHSHAYTLYAGGGLLASSDLQSEWQETENKMQTMGALFK